MVFHLTLNETDSQTQRYTDTYIGKIYGNLWESRESIFPSGKKNLGSLCFLVFVGTSFKIKEKPIVVRVQERELKSVGDTYEDRTKQIHRKASRAQIACNTAPHHGSFTLCNAFWRNTLKTSSAVQHSPSTAFHKTVKLFWDYSAFSLCEDISSAFAETLSSNPVPQAVGVRLLVWLMQT